MRTSPRFTELILSAKHVATRPHPHAAEILKRACRCPIHLHTTMPQQERMNQSHHEESRCSLLRTCYAIILLQGPPACDQKSLRASKAISSRLRATATQTLHAHTPCLKNDLHRNPRFKNSSQLRHHATIICRAAAAATALTNKYSSTMLQDGHKSTSTNIAQLKSPAASCSLLKDTRSAERHTRHERDIKVLRRALRKRMLLLASASC